MTENQKKTYVLDTNVLISDPDSLHVFEENDIILPFTVIKELDDLKKRQGEVGQNSRLISRRLNEYRSKDPGMLSRDGVVIHPSQDCSGVLRILSVSDEEWNEHNKLIGNVLDKTISDDQIIMTAMIVRNKCHNTILISNDFNVLLKAEHVGVKCEEYKRIRISETSKMYSGISKMSVTSNESILKMYSESGIHESDVVEIDTRRLYPNQYVIASDGERNSLLGRFYGIENGSYDIRPISKNAQRQVFGLTPLNKEQKCSMDALLDPNISIVTLTGPSGCGKTLLAIASGLEQTLNSNVYERLIVTRPVEPIGRDLGFLPGSFEEKMMPWIQPIYDNISFLTSKKSKNKVLGAKRYDASRKKIRSFNEYDSLTNRDPFVAELQDSGKLEIEALTYIRGRSLPNCFMIVDESQNLSLHALKTIITRAGEKTKIILCGDIEQIDSRYLDAYTNGLTHAVEKFKNFEFSAHISLIKGERSELATVASQIL